MTIDEMKARKRELGYTNEKIAELADVPLGTVHKIFSGQTASPRYNTIMKLESVLSVQSDCNKFKNDYNHSRNEGFEHFKVDGFEDGCYVAETVSVGLNYCSGAKRDTLVGGAWMHDYASNYVEKRIGIAAGKYKVPDDSFFYDDEISEMFEDI